MARRFMPVAALLPIAIGGLEILGYRSGLFDNRHGMALSAVCSLNLLLGFIWWNAASLHRIDGERRRAEEALRGPRRARGPRRRADGRTLGGERGAAQRVNGSSERSSTKPSSTSAC